jgi:signal transduction histidine kinase/CheY-like chemotaxis protein
MPRASAATGAQLTDAIEALSEGFALFDDAGQLIVCNARWRKYNPHIADLLEPGASWDVLVRESRLRGALDADAAQRLLAIERRLAPGEAPQSFEVEGPTGRVTVLTLAATRQGGFVMTLRDVTARRRLEDEDREAEQLLRSVLESCPANLMMSRLHDAQVIYRSPAATALLGAIRNDKAFFALREERADFITSLLPNGRVDDLRFTAVAQGGVQFPATISARLIDFRNEEVIVATIVDLSRETALQAELAAQRETIYQNEKMSALGEMLAGIAHELNNPLSVVVGHAQILCEETLDPRVLRRVERISHAAERCARIVKSFLAMARKSPAALVPIDLNAALAVGLDVLRNGPAGITATLETALAEGLPPVLADGDQVAQVVVNLVVNADQAIAKSGVGSTIRVSSRVDDASAMLEFAVEDDGPGIPQAILGRIFEPFFTTKEIGEGTGIGLALCHRVVTAHGGEIRVTCGQSGGTRFTVRLPATATATPQAVNDEDAEVPTRRARVLIVEDEEEVAELMCEVLRKQGFAVDHVATGDAALRAIAEHPYAAIVSDLNMPKLDGRGLYETLLREHPVLAPHVGFVTGDTMGAPSRAFLDEVKQPYLEKPIVPSELRSLVARLLGKDGLRSEA